ncbi:MAG TPA: hypothetical protein VFP50_01365, partial [Anaeromyxobacteraceae bacterium]|nr:hypothetical protein [Anaeromyxobacteraceae bacterium]
VTHKPALTGNDPYTVQIDWANDPAATGFVIERSDTDATDAAPAGNWAAIPGSPFTWVDPNTGAHRRDTGLTPGSIFWYRVTPQGLTPAGAPSTPNRVELAGPPSIKATGNPVDATSGTKINGTVELVFSRIRTAQYRVQRAPPPPDAATPPVWTDAATLTTGAGVAVANPAPQQGSTVVLRETGVPIGTWLYRVVPVFAAGDGTPTKSATAVVAQ